MLVVDDGANLVCLKFSDDISVCLLMVEAETRVGSPLQPAMMVELIARN
jgi:hypothetical protein